MLAIETHKLTPASLSPTHSHWVYNGLDTAVTFEVLEALESILGPAPNDVFDPQFWMINWAKGDHPKIISAAQHLTYNFERAMQGPALEMMLRGWRVNLHYRDAAVSRLRVQDAKISNNLDTLAEAVWGRGLNPNSPAQLKEFFYHSMGLPEQFRFDKGRKVVTTNRDALENLANYFFARPIVSHILALRDIRKKISVLTTEVDGDKRMRTSYNVTGTESGRWSSSKNVWGGGTNLQNITEELRRAFVADEGYKLAYLDLEQAESRAVGWIIWLIFQDAVYLDACEAGDLHTEVARMVWPGLDWTGDLKGDKAVAETLFYRHFSYRDLSKRGGHGSNYYGKPPTMARHLHVTTKLMADFQERYFAAFPGIPAWHRWTAERIQLHQYLLTPLGMGRHFFSRPGDDATLREGIAHVPQSMVAQLLNLALYRLWTSSLPIQLIGQVHDAVVFQYREADEAEVIPAALALMDTPLSFHGRSMTIPSEALVGWNWQKQDPKKKFSIDGNPDGLRKWDGGDSRKRTQPPTFAGLDFKLP